MLFEDTYYHDDASSSEFAATWLDIVGGSVASGQSFRKRSIRLSCPGLPNGEPEHYRVTVQLFTPKAWRERSLAEGEEWLAGVEAFASSVRHCTHEELAKGIHLELFGFGSPELAQKCVALYWIDRSNEELEMDGAFASPSKDSLMGTAQLPKIDGESDRLSTLALKAS